MARLLTLSLLTLGVVLSLHAQTSWFEYTRNPVLVPGASQFDSYYTLSPTVLHTDSLYRMWYVGFDGATFRIGYATSKKGTTWDRPVLSPVLSPVPGSLFESQHVWVSVVIPVSQGYRMYYSGSNGSVWQVCTAFSQDGKTWERSGSNPILRPGSPSSWEKSVYAVSVVEVGSNDYRMWYTGIDSLNVTRIGYATSSDGIQWQKYAGNPIMGPGENSAVESQVRTPRVVKIDSVFHMMYTMVGRDGLSRYGYAKSTDGTVWKRYAENPVMVGSVAWESGSRGDHCLLHENGVFHFWYSGAPTFNGPWYIGYAVAGPAITNIAETRPLAPGQTVLCPAYPNPFNPSTTIRYMLGSRTGVRLAIYNVIGQEVLLRTWEEQDAGQHEVRIDAAGWSSGLYYYRLITGSSTQTRTMLLLR